MSQGANKDGIISAGKTAIVCLYNRNPHHGINVLRYDKLCVKVATSTVPVEPVELPYTSGSVKYHSLRVHHQIQEWSGIQMSSVDWCWRVGAGNLLPIMTHLQPAPHCCACKYACSTMLSTSAGVYVLIIPMTLILSLARIPNLYWSDSTVHCYNI